MTNNTNDIFKEAQTLNTLTIPNTLNYNSSYYQFAFYNYDKAVYNEYTYLLNRYETTKDIYVDTIKLNKFMEIIKEIKTQFNYSNTNETFNFYFFVDNNMYNKTENIFNTLNDFINFKQYYLTWANVKDIMCRFYNWDANNNHISSFRAFDLVSLSIKQQTFNSTMTIYSFKCDNDEFKIETNTVQIDLKLIPYFLQLHKYLRTLSFRDITIKNQHLHFYLYFHLGYHLSSNNLHLPIIKFMNEKILYNTNFKMVIKNDATYLAYDTNYANLDLDSLKQISKDLEFLKILDTFGIYFLTNKKYDLDLSIKDENVLLKYYHRIINHKIPMNTFDAKIPYYYGNVNDYLDYQILDIANKKTKKEFYL